MSKCPARDQLERLLAEQLSDDERDTVNAHVENCPACQKTLEELVAQVAGMLSRERPGDESVELAPRKDGTPPDKPGREFLRQLKEGLAGTWSDPISHTSPAAPPQIPPGPADGVPADGVHVPGYEILCELGRGGMGVVYQAWQAGLNRLVALKMVLAGGHAGAEARARFRTEAESVARLQHPNIVQVYEVAEHDGLPYLSLEFVEGGNLARKLAGTRLPSRQAAELTETLARAVHYAHGRGVVHRDLKPANVLLTASDATSGPLGIPKIGDFSLAKILIGGGVSPTQSGDILGTPSYMAPEQAGGKSRDTGPATDVYALGAILYECLTGRPPFKADTPLDTLLHVISTEAVPPSRLQPKVPRDLETICLKCLQKEPRKRYASALELADELRRHLDGQPIRSRPVGTAERLWRWARRKPALAGLNGLAALTVAAAILVFVGFNLLKSRLSREEQINEANKALERGIALCEQGEAAHGMLWLARSLELAPVDEPDLQDAIRINLAGWRHHVHALKAVLPHKGEVIAVAFSPDGKTIWTGSADGTAQSWDIATGSALSTVSFGRKISALAFSLDCKRVATVKEDRIVQLWDAATGEGVGQPLRHEHPVDAVAFSGDGTRLLTGTDTGARLWDAATGEARGVLLQDASVFRGAFSPDGTAVVTASKRRGAYLWDVRNGKNPGRRLSPEPNVQAVTFSPDGKTVATSAGERIDFWNAATGERLDQVLLHQLRVESVAFSADGSMVLTGSRDRTARLWDAATGKPLGHALRHEDDVLAVTFSPDGKHVLTGSADQGARLWEIASAQTLGPPLAHKHAVLRLALSRDGKMILSGSADSTAGLWETVTGKRLHTLEHGHWVEAVAFSRDGKTVATGSRDKIAALWEVATGERLAEFHHDGRVWDVAFSRDGKTLLSGSGDQSKTAQLWDIATRTLRARLEHGAGVYRVAFSSEGETVLTASADNTAQLWKAASGEHLRTFAHDHWVEAAAFGPDGKTVLTGSADKTGQLWRLATGERLGPPLQHHGPVYVVAFSPDGRTALTGSTDKTAQLWNAVNGTHLATFAHHGEVRSVAFSPDGKTVLTGSFDNTARLWQAASGKKLGPPLSHKHHVRAAVFSPDGKTIVTGSLDKTIQRWRVPEPLQGPAERIVPSTQAIAGMELEESGTARVMDARRWQQCRQALAGNLGQP